MQCTPVERTKRGDSRSLVGSGFWGAFAVALLLGCFCSQPAMAQPASSVPFLDSNGVVLGPVRYSHRRPLKQLIASISSGLPDSSFLPLIPKRRPTGWRYRLAAEKSSGAARVENASQAGKGKKHPSQFSGSPRHIFWVVPAFNVDYASNFHPLTPKEKFDEWARGAYDPLGLAAGAFEAGTEYSPTSGFCDYGQGWRGYGECFGSAELDANVSSFFGDFVFTVLMHQDPRYFRLGHGSFGRRLWYAVSRVWLTHSDSGHIVFYSSALSGTVLAAAVSNLYYPQQERGFSLTLSRIGWDLGDTALYNAAAEFWPGIRHEIYRTF